VVGLFEFSKCSSYSKMTTAHRPTFHPALGGTGKNEGDLSKLSKQYSSRDMPSHTKVKYRQTGQGSAEELKSKDLRKELEEREKAVGRDRRGKDSSASSSSATASVSVSSAKKPRLDQIGAGSNIDADDPLDDDDDQEDDDDEDDTAELMAELARIKKEREADNARIEAEKKAQEEKIRTESILHGNPLLAGSTKQDFKVKRRWDDDVVFKNCAKGLDYKKKDATFINDALRSEFHKKFMEKYIK